MAQNQPNTAEENIGAAMGRTEAFFENNGKALTLGLIALVVLGGLIVGYRKLVTEPRRVKATELLSQAQIHFESSDADYQAALMGDDNGAGFLEVIEKYGSTPAGNLAKHYAGVCYLKQGALDEAAKYLAQYTAVKGIAGAILNAQNLGLQGDIAVDQGDYGKAVSLYEKAIAATDNPLTAPIYLRKAGIAYRELGQTDKAKTCFERIEFEYPMSYEAQECSKLLNTL